MDGDDLMRSGAGNDTLIGGNGDDNMDGGTGVDTASYAGAGSGVHVSLATTSYQDTGGAGFDKLVNIENLTGSSFDDTLTGNTARNVITGGAGADTMTGGLGIDTFVYGSASDSAYGHADTITDLANTDRIDLTALGNDFSIVNSFDGHAHEITLSYNSTTHMTTISIDMDGNGLGTDAGDMQILLNGDHHTFTNFLGLGTT
jgi:Ca2+-binding RTX toxin-like protein